MPSRSKPLTEDLRWVLVRMHCVEGLETSQISQLTGVHIRTIQKVLKIHKETGRVMPRSSERKMRPKKLDEEDRQFIEGVIEHSPDAYLDEIKEQLQEATGTNVALSTVWRALKKIGFSMKKISKAAMERNEAKRLRFIYKMGSRYKPEQLVFVDESSFDRRTAYRGYAWALKGQRALRKCFYVRGKRYSILPAICTSGMLWCHIVEGAYNAARFRKFIEDLLDQMQPFPAPNSVIVMDNARIHKDPELIALIESRGMKVEFLPAYSPDFNPIEQAFSIIKAFVRRHYPHFARTDTTGTNAADAAEVYDMLFEAVYSITPEQAEAFYHHSGYL